MNDNRTNGGGKVIALKIRFQLQDIEKLFPIAIRVVGKNGAGERPFVGSAEPAAVRAKNP